MTENTWQSVYTPAKNEPNSVTQTSLNDALENYIQTEFPKLFGQTTTSYIVPATFRMQDNQCLSAIPSSLISKTDPQRVQGDMAEEIIYNALKNMKIPGVVFYGHTYINQTKFGKTFKEHDFVILTAENKIALIEDKSCADIQGPLMKVLSDGKSIRDNRRSGLHQLEAHIALLSSRFGLSATSIGQILAWPFLSRQDSQGRERFTQDSSSEKYHIFKDICQDQDAFFAFLFDYLKDLSSLEDESWKSVLKWFSLLGCSAVIDSLMGSIDSQLILLSQEQMSVVHGKANDGDDPIIIYGPPGSGKTLLILIKMKQLWEDNLIGPNNHCLLLTGRYNSGITYFVEKYFEKCGVKSVTIKSLPSSHETFQSWCTKETNSFSHIFIDGVEDLAWYGNIPKNINFVKTTRKATENGYFLCMLDGSQLVYNLAIHGGPQATNQVTPKIKLSKCFRSTENIFSFTTTCLKETESETYKNNLTKGPPVFFVNYDNFVSREEAVCMLVIDLCGYKGVKPNDVVLMTSSSILHGRLNVTAINQGLKTYFQGKGFIPKGIVGASRFLSSNREELFCVSSVSDYKGLEAKVVIVLPILFNNSSTEMIRRMLYSMSSRCTCLLIIVWNDTNSIGVIDIKTLLQYSFTSSECPLQEFFKKVDDDNKVDTERLKKEAVRLKTFETYPTTANVKPKDLAKKMASFLEEGRVILSCVSFVAVSFMTGNQMTFLREYTSNSMATVHL